MLLRTASLFDEINRKVIDNFVGSNMLSYLTDYLIRSMKILTKRRISNHYSLIVQFDGHNRSKP